MDGNGRTGNYRCVMIVSRVDSFQRFSPETAQFRKQLTVIQKIAYYNFRNVEHYMPVGNILDDLPAEPLVEFHNPLLMAGWTKIPSLARKGQQKLVATVLPRIKVLLSVQVYPVSLQIESTAGSILNAESVPFAVHR